MEKQNDPSREGEAVNCLLGGDNHGHSTSRRERKPILSIRLGEEALERNLWQQVNRWDLDRRVNGVVPGNRKLRPEEAAREIGLAMARLKQGGEL